LYISFDVHTHANKKEICAAIKHIYGLVPQRIRVVNIASVKTVKRNKLGRTKALRKAYVYLKKGDAMMDTYLFADDSFDIVICSAHGTCAYPELPQLFSEIARVTIKGGILLLDLPQAPIDIGPNLMTDFRSYIRMLKNAGFKIQQLVQKQAVCSLVEKKRWEGASL
jgi:ribosomal protein L23